MHAIGKISGVVVLTLLMGCGGEPVAPTVQGKLPVQRGALLSDLCFSLDPSTAQPPSERFKAKRQLTALLDALRRAPDARVRTWASDHDGDRIEKTISVTDLSETHERELGLNLQLAGPEADRCARHAVQRLRNARDGG